MYHLTFKWQFREVGSDSHMRSSHEVERVKDNSSKSTKANRGFGKRLLLPLTCDHRTEFWPTVSKKSMYKF